MVEDMQYTGVMLMALMTMALAFWMPKWLNDDRVVNRSRWLMAGGLALLGMQFSLQYHYGFRAMGVTQAVIINLLFFIPCSTLISLSMLNLQRQGRIRWREWFVGPVALAAAAAIMLTAAGMNGQPLLSDTPEMRQAALMASVCYITMQVCYTYLLLTELHRMRAALANYFDRERSNMLRWMQYSIMVLTVLALLVPVLIYHTGLILSAYGLLFVGSIFYMWLQFVGYIRTNAAMQMREAEENEEEVQQEVEDDARENKKATSKDTTHRIAKAADHWLAQGGHLRSGITIKTVSQEIGVPRYQLTNWLKTTSHEQFSRWITFHRIEAAKQLLKSHPDWSNETIAQQCGFNTRNYFQTVFKKSTGLSPTEYQTSQSH